MLHVRFQPYQCQYPAVFDRWNSAVPFDFIHLALSLLVFEPLCIQRLGAELHVLGCLNGSELLLLLPQAKRVGSGSIVNTVRRRGLGMVIFSSCDMQYY